MSTINQFALGETIPLKWENLTWAGKTPETLAGLTFILTVREGGSTEDKLRLENGNGLLVTGASLSASIDTSAAGWRRVSYNADLWVVDPDTGKHRLDAFSITLQKPETTDFDV